MKNSKVVIIGFIYMLCIISVLFIFIFFFPVVTSDSPIPTNHSPSWTLVWSDEFNDPTLNLSKWDHEVNANGGGNNELQYYTNRTNNSFINNGSLIIRVEKEVYSDIEGTRNYTSARLRTKGKGDWKYGNFEVRALVPSGKGIWPAIWMLPTNETYGTWAASGEIDIMELKGSRPNEVSGTLHYGGKWPDNVYSGDSYVLSSGNFSDEFHVFSLVWEPEQIKWYVDGILYQNQTNWFTKNSTYPAPFDQEFHLLLNVAVGGNYDGNPDETTRFPQEMKVDYVRVYKIIIF